MISLVQKLMNIIWYRFHRVEPPLPQSRRIYDPVMADLIAEDEKEKNHEG